MHWYSDSNLNSFQRTHSAAPTPDPLNLLLSSPQFWLQRLLFAMLYPFHTFCSTGIQQTIKAEPFPISSSCVFPNMSAEWPTADLPSRAGFGQSPITCSMKATWRRYELTSCRRTSAAASVDPFLPSATQSAAAPLTYDCTRWLHPPCIMDDILPMCFLTCDMLAWGSVPDEKERTQKSLTSVGAEFDNLAAFGQSKSKPSPGDCWLQASPRPWVQEKWV